MPNDVTAARCDGSTMRENPICRPSGFPRSGVRQAEQRAKAATAAEFVCGHVPAPRTEFGRIDRKRPALFAVQQRRRRLQRLHAATLGNFPGDHQAKCDRQPDARRRSTEQQPQGAGHGRIQLRHRHADMDRPSFGAGQDAVDGFNIDALTRLGSRRIRAAARNGFLHGRCCRARTWRFSCPACARRSFPWRQ